jgi:hypothetical protein
LFEKCFGEEYCEDTQLRNPLIMCFIGDQTNKKLPLGGCGSSGKEVEGVMTNAGIRF